MIELDGSQGEGGGQILRSALSLAMITQQPFCIERIRARRAKPGLLRQHLTAVKAAAEICGAEVTGDTPGSQKLCFRPGPIRGGDYRYAIGTAGSATLVLQTVLPALWFADAASTVTISGGTHNPAAPPADFLIRSWLPLIRRMGVDMDIELLRHGFFPAGGGEIRIRVAPVQTLQALELNTRGKLLSLHATAVIAGVPFDVAQRELERLGKRIEGLSCETRSLPSREGPGNVLMLEAAFDHVCELFIGFGERGLAAEKVADRVAHEARAYLAGTAPVGEHLADQLVLPMALAGKGCFVTGTLSSHLQTNIDVVSHFLPVNPIILETEGAFRIEIGAP